MLYCNIAKSYSDKATTLKTEKSRTKYYDMAMAILQEGRNDARSDKALLTRLRDDLAHERAR